MLAWLISLLIAGSVAGGQQQAGHPAHPSRTECYVAVFGESLQPCRRFQRLTGLGTNPARRISPRERHVCPKAVENVPGVGVVHEPPPNAFDADRLVGRSVPRAQRIAHRHGCTVRVAVRNGKDLYLTADLQPNRTNVVVRDGRVVRVTKIA